MELQLPRNTFQAYFRDTEGRFYNYEHGVLGVAAATDHQREFLNGRMNSEIVRNATVIVGKPITCRFTKAVDIVTGEKQLRRGFDRLRSSWNQVDTEQSSKAQQGELGYILHDRNQVYRYIDGEDVSAGLVVAIHNIGNERHADLQRTQHSQNQWDTVDAETLLSAGTPIRADVSDTVILKELRPRPLLNHSQISILSVTTGGWALVVDPFRPGNHWIPSALGPTDRPPKYFCGPADHPENRVVVGQGFVLSDRTIEALESRGVKLEGRSTFSSVRTGDFVQNDPSKGDR